MSTQPQVEYVAHAQIGEKGQLTIPKTYRDELGLDPGSPVAVLRIGNGLILIPEHARFRALSDSIASFFERHNVTAEDLVSTLPEAREYVFAKHYPTLAAKEKRRKRKGSRR
jgi:AbrB family looped-hinge helix DNA binding protein